jgi:MoaA/NifB/PqqE/SkfB family radical SAM enzyme
MPRQPILINWLITGRCPLACRYCYAEDLMRDEALEPKSVDIERIVESILSLNPLVVVVTGGDPLFSGHLAEAVHLLSGKVGIIVDTSGYTFTPKRLELFKQHHVSVRISLDSERPKVNQTQRPLYPGYRKLAKRGIPAAVAAVNTLCQCLDAGLCVSVQTVATKKNANDLVTFGDKLYRLGVQSWRIFKVGPSKASYEGYKKLVGAVTDSGKKWRAKRREHPTNLRCKRSPTWVNDAARHRRFWRSPGDGSQEGTGSPRRAAAQAAVRSSRTWRCCGVSVATIVIMASTTREPSALWVPTRPLRQSTRGRLARSAAWFVGSPSG